MNAYTTSISLDVNKAAQDRKYVARIVLRQQDNKTTLLKVALTQDGLPVDLRGTTVSFRGTTPTGAFVEIPLTVTHAEAGRAEGVLTSALTNDAGRYLVAYIAILQGADEVASTGDIEICVLGAADVHAKVAKDFASSFDTTLKNAQAQAQAALDKLKSLNDAQVQNFQSAQDARNRQQAKNNADQAQNNQSAKGLVAVILKSGQYDEASRVPTAATGKTGTLYLVPSKNHETDNSYDEFMFIQGSWEKIGSSTPSLEAISTNQIDDAWAGANKTGDQVLNLTGLTYLDTLIKSKNDELAQKITTLKGLYTNLKSEFELAEQAKPKQNEVSRKRLSDRVEALRVGNVVTLTVLGVHVDTTQNTWIKYPLGTLDADMIPASWNGVSAPVSTDNTWAHATIDIYKDGGVYLQGRGGTGAKTDFYSNVTYVVEPPADPKPGSAQ